MWLLNPRGRYWIAQVKLTPVKQVKNAKALREEINLNFNRNVELLGAVEVLRNHFRGKGGR